jgi:hypothetical protein
VWSLEEAESMGVTLMPRYGNYDRSLNTLLSDLRKFHKMLDPNYQPPNEQSMGLQFDSFYLTNSMQLFTKFSVTELSMSHVFGHLAEYSLDQYRPFLSKPAATYVVNTEFESTAKRGDDYAMGICPPCTKI